MTKLSFPFTKEKFRVLKVGDEVLISGIVFTVAVKLNQLEFYSV
jgi:tartrate dehydratase beta subunit/fumarate hydratase class I family protein